MSNESRFKNIDARLAAIEEWISEFERGYEEAERELTEMVEFVLDSDLEAEIFRDKDKDH